MFDIYLPYFSILLFVFGAVIGSFANVVIYRWPKGESIVLPNSRCPSCLMPIKWFDNVPILSWILLKGKCRSCKSHISIRYPLVELSMGLLFVITYYFTGFSWLFLEYLIFSAGLLTASMIDVDHFLLPDIITIPGIILGLLGAYLNPEREFIQALFGVIFGGGFLWAIAYFYFLIRKEEGMGGGDIKLLAWIGAVLGWQAIPFVIISASLLGTVLGLALTYKQKKGLKTVIPFGPYLAAGALFYIFGGETIAKNYIHFFIPGL